MQKGFKLKYLKTPGLGPHF